MSAPHRLQIGTQYPDAIALINDNFDNVVQDVRDLGANLSTVGTYSLTVGASSLASFVFTLTSQGVVSTSAHQVFTQKPVSAVSGIAPQVDVYIDNDNNSAYLYPTGTSLGSGLLAAFVNVAVNRSGYSNSLASYMIQINNRDVSSHTYYIHTQCGYFPTASTSQYQ